MYNSALRSSLMLSLGWFPYCGADLKSKQKVVDVSHNILGIIARVGILSRQVVTVAFRFIAVHD